MRHELRRQSRYAGAAAPALPDVPDYADLAALPGEAPPLARHLETLRHTRRVDYLLVLAVAGLLVIGLVMVFSASQYAVAGDPSYWFRHQVVWSALGLVALGVCATVDYHHWRRLAFPAMLVSLVLLLLVLGRGESIYGAQRWLRLGISIQPSELAKLALALYLADWLVRKGDEVRSLMYGLVPFLALLAAIVCLILLQNDLGTTIVLAMMAGAVFFAAGANPLHLLAALGGGAAGALALSLGSAFRRARLEAFLNPLPPGCSAAASYQVCQGLISLGSGGIGGRGLGDGLAKAGYLPNPFTDSIFAVTGEELGLIGCLTIVVLFGLLAWRGLRAGRRAPDAYGALLACGITCWLVVQAAVNIGSVVDVIPFTGVPLPFVSFGGSSLVTSLAAVGIVLNISRRAGDVPDAPTSSGR